MSKIVFVWLLVFVLSSTVCATNLDPGLDKISRMLEIHFDYQEFEALILETYPEGYVGDLDSLQSDRLRKIHELYVNEVGVFYDEIGSYVSPENAIDCLARLRKFDSLLSVSFQGSKNTPISMSKAKSMFVNVLLYYHESTDVLMSSECN